MADPSRPRFNPLRSLDLQGKSKDVDLPNGDLPRVYCAVGLSCSEDDRDPLTRLQVADSPFGLADQRGSGAQLDRDWLTIKTISDKLVVLEHGMLDEDAGVTAVASTWSALRGARGTL